MNFYKILIVLTFLLPGLVSASEFLYQPTRGQHVVEMDYSYRALGIDFKDSTFTKVKEWNWNFQTVGLSYEWGISDMIAVGIGLDYVQGNLEFNGIDDWHIDGLEDIEISLKGNYAFNNMFKLFYGLNADLSLEDQDYSDEDKFQYDGTQHSVRINSSRGRHDIIPYLAFEAHVSNMNVGGKIAYRLTTEQTQNKLAAGVETESTFEGEEGIFVSAFLEHKLDDDSTLGYAATYMTFEDLIATNGPNDGLNSNKNYEYSTDGFLFDIYGKVKAANGLYFLPKFTYYLLSDEYPSEEFAPLAETDIKSTGASYKIEFKLRKEF